MLQKNLLNLKFECPPDLQVYKTDREIIVLLNDDIVYQIDKTDKTTFRYTIIQLYLNNLGTQKNIADAFGITSRSITSWYHKYLKGGFYALVNKTQGAPIKITDDLIEQIRLSRDDKLTIDKLSQMYRISRGKICEIINYKTYEEPNNLFNQSELDALESQDNDEFEILNENVELEEEKEIDPLDRSNDRHNAYMGLIDDADPYFASTKHLENAGSLLAVALLSQENYFSIIDKVYKTIGPAFYGLRNIFMILFLMAVTRKKNADTLGKGAPDKLGRLAGLDRSPCTKILRGKIEQLAFREKGFELMSSIGKNHIEQASTNLDIILYTDGHVKRYYGSKKLGKTFSTSSNRVVKGSTDYWLNLGDGTPLLCIPTEFNDSMFSILPKVIKDAKNICSNKRITIVFDRGGSSAYIYEKLIKLDVDFIAYNKTPKTISDTLFKKEKVILNGKEYEYLPYDRNIDLDIYEKNSRGAYKNTNRKINVREVIVKRNDGKQTAVLTNRKDLSNIQVPSIIFNRWTQENFFKYLKANYGLDALSTYKTIKVSEDIDHPNPEYINCQKKINKINLKIK